MAVAVHFLKNPEFKDENETKEEFIYYECQNN